MSPEFTDEEIDEAMYMVRPLRPIHVPVERAAEHPLLRFAVVDDGGYVQWPGLTERQARVARDTVTRQHNNGAPYYSMPPRINADWFLPPDPTDDDLRMRYGSHHDLQRWYLVIDPVADPCEARLVTAFTVEGLRTFMQRAHRAGWMPLPANLFVTMLDNPELIVVPTDEITAKTWELIWWARTGG